MTSLPDTAASIIDLAAPRYSAAGAAVAEAFGDFRKQIAEITDAGSQLRKDYAELESKRDLLPGAGFQRLRRLATEDAAVRGRDADGAARQALDRIRGELTTASLPKVPADREALARQELSEALGPKPTLERIVNLAANGSRESIAALFSPFGRTILESRGVPGTDYVEALDAARQVAAATAVDRGETETERAASALLDNVGTLGAALGAAGVDLHHAAEGVTTEGV